MRRINLRRTPKRPQLGDRLRYERLPEGPPPWPRSIAAIRAATFESRFLELSPAIARRGSWLVHAVATRESIGYVWIVRAVGTTNGAYVEEVAVRHESQGLGIGTHLLVEASHWMAEQGWSWIGISSLADAQQGRRQAWFASIGFEHEGGGMFGASPGAIAIPPI